MAKATPIEIASYRLCNFDRDSIQRRALESAFGREETALAKRESDLCRRCYNQVIPADVRRKVSALPDTWFRTNTQPHFNVGGLHIGLKSSEPLRVPSGDDYGRIGVIKDRELIDAINQLIADKGSFGERRSKASAAIKGPLYSVTTSKKLVELWPEAKPFLQGIGVAVEVKVPAAQISELNKMLGLKKAA